MATFAYLLLLAVSQVSLGEDNRIYQVHRIVPSNVAALESLVKLYLESVEADFWVKPENVNNPVEILVKPEFRDDFYEFMRSNRLKSEIIVEDLSKLIETKEIKSDSEALKSFNRRFKDDRSIFNQLLMGEYHSYEAISNWLRQLERSYPEIVEFVSIGYTHEGRSINGVKIGTKKKFSPRILWIDGGIHSREWAAIHTALFFIRELTSRYMTDQNITKYINTIDIYIFPCLNPDGYEYTRKDPRDPGIRMWRKNRSPAKCMTRKGRQSCCQGVDLNRNFAFHFAEVGTSSAPCSEIYRGEYAFSEPETRAVRDKVLSLRPQMDGFITLHSYSQLWIYPFSHKKFSYSADVKDLRDVARKAVESLEKVYGTRYRYGTGPEIIYAYSGGSADWVKEAVGVKYAYTIELRPNVFAWNGFVLDKSQLIPTGKETFEGVKVVIEKIIDEQGLKIPNGQFKSTKICSDRSPSCVAWISQSPRICGESQSSMLTYCKKSCSFCSARS